jgi:hypothetical protein
MTSGSIEYFDGKITVWVEGNMWTKQARGLDEAGIDLNDQEAVAAFTKAAAPGGKGLEAYGYKPMRMQLGSSQTSGWPM